MNPDDSQALKAAAWFEKKATEEANGSISVGGLRGDVREIRGVELPYNLEEAFLSREEVVDRGTGWIQTFTGRQVYPLDLRPEDVDPWDLAHSLANLCRYNGHCSPRYSVARHSLILAWLGPEKQFLRRLLHDAAEAYFGDLPRPLKRLPEFKFYRDAEARAQTTIYNFFGLPAHDPCDVEIRRDDIRITLDERRRLMAPPPALWLDLEGLTPFGADFDMFFNIDLANQDAVIFLASLDILEGR